MCVGVLPACVSICHMCAYGGQGTASDPLELKLQMALRYQVGAGSCVGQPHSSPVSHPSSPSLAFQPIKSLNS